MHRVGVPRECQGRLTCRRSDLPIGRLSGASVDLRRLLRLETPCSVLDQHTSLSNMPSMVIETESPLVADKCLRQRFPGRTLIPVPAGHVPQVIECTRGLPTDHPDRVLRPLKRVAERRRSGGAGAGRVGGKARIARGHPRSRWNLRRTRRRRARLHEVDAGAVPGAGGRLAALAGAHRERLSPPLGTCPNGRLVRRAAPI